jgi:hypothetical protein
MKNIIFKVDKDVLTITVNLKERHGVSSTGKTDTVATSSGNVDIGQDGIKFGLNVFAKRKAE